MIEFKDALISLSRDGRKNLTASLRLESGDRAVLLGLNGSGKTSLLDVIAGVGRVDAGSFRIESVHDPIAYVVQDSASGLLPWRSILSNILLPSQLRDGAGEGLQHKAGSLLTAFGLAERMHDFPYKLSEGEKEIVNLIRAVCTPAKVVLLDEPFASLNAVARGRAKSILLEFSKGRTIVLVTHDPTDLDWPFTRFLQVVNSGVVETNLQEAKDFLENAVSKSET